MDSNKDNKLQTKSSIIINKNKSDVKLKSPKTSPKLIRKIQESSTIIKKQIVDNNNTSSNTINKFNCDNISKGSKSRNENFQKAAAFWNHQQK